MQTKKANVGVKENNKVIVKEQITIDYPTNKEELNQFIEKYGIEYTVKQVEKAHTINLQANARAKYSEKTSRVNKEKLDMLETLEKDYGIKGKQLETLKTLRLDQLTKEAFKILTNK